MRSFVIGSAVLLLAVFAAAQTGGQATVIGGYASNWVPAPGAYAVPFAPLVNTPEVSLDAVPGSAVGASNATPGNVAGAVNATVSVVPEAGPFAVPMWYAPSYAPGPTGFQAAPPMMTQSQENGSSEGLRGTFDLGIARFQNSEGVATLMKQEHIQPPKPAARVYTNEDVEKLDAELNQSVGSVRFDGKTEHLNSAD